MSTYLSIDLDYWGMQGTDRHMLPFVQRVLALKKPTVLVRDHHHLLPHINRFPSDRLINLDYHDDIVYMPTQEDRYMPVPEEGTWVNHVQWRAGAWFQWMHPHDRFRILEGICDPIADVYSPDRNAEAQTGWRRVTLRRGHATLPWDDVVAVGIALSPGYWHRALDDFHRTSSEEYQSIGYYARTVKLLTGRDMRRVDVQCFPHLYRIPRRAA